MMDILHRYIMPHEERKIEKAAAQEKIDNHKPVTAIEATEQIIASLLESLTHNHENKKLKPFSSTLLY